MALDFVAGCFGGMNYKTISNFIYIWVFLDLNLRKRNFKISQKGGTVKEAKIKKKNENLKFVIRFFIQYLLI